MLKYWWHLLLIGPLTYCLLTCCWSPETQHELVTVCSVCWCCPSVTDIATYYVCNVTWYLCHSKCLCLSKSVSAAIPASKYAVNRALSTAASLITLRLPNLTVAAADKHDNFTGLELTYNEIFKLHIMPRGLSATTEFLVHLRRLAALL